jgi:rhodanese-related sulfurtransferase
VRAQAGLTLVSPGARTRCYTFGMLRRTLFAVLLAAAASAQDQSKWPPKLTVEEMDKYLEEKKVFWLDVREPKELVEFGALPGYVNIPLGQLESRLSEIPKDKLILTVCQRAMRAGRAADILEKHGYRVTGRCAMIDWKEKGRPVIYPKESEAVKPKQ